MTVYRENNCSAWFMSEDKCPVTGLALSCRETLVPRSPDNPFRADIVKIGDRILLIKGRGYVDTHTESEFLSFVDDFALRHFPPGEKIIFMEDYADIAGSDAGSRKQYIAYFTNQKNMLAGIVFNVLPLMRISFNLFKKLHPAGFKAHAVSTYEEAMALATKLLDGADPPTEDGHRRDIERALRKKPAAKTLDISGLRAWISGKLQSGKTMLTKTQRRSLARRFSDELIRYIASIDWRSPGIGPPAAILGDDVSSAKVFDAISFIKSEIDALLAERVRTEAELREREARERLLIQHAKAGFMVYDFTAGRITRVNDSLLEMTGYTEAELQAMTLTGLMTENGQKLFAAGYRDILVGRPISQNVVYEGRKKNGEIWWALLNAVISYENGQAVIAHVVVTDITHLKRTEKQLLEYQEKLKALAVQLSMAEEDQRREMASRLHETIGQELFVLLLQLDRFERKLGVPEKISEVRGMREQVLKIIRETKDLTFDLSPPALYDFGFQEALEALSRTVCNRHGIFVKTYFEGEMDAISNEIKMIVYRCIKELIHNTVKHAHAATIDLQLKNNGDGLKVRFRDDGVGCAPEVLDRSPQARNGFGLFDIREKIDHLGGDFVVDASPGRGIDILMMVPMPEQA